MKVDEACIPVYVGGRDSGETGEKVKEVAKKLAQAFCSTSKILLKSYS